jgi:hypothetical protein
MITQIIWLATLPVVIFISYRLILLVYKHLEKKQIL